MSITDSLTTFGRQLVVGTGGARGNAGGRGGGKGKGGGFGLGGGNSGRGGGNVPWTPALAGAYAWWDGANTAGNIITGSGISQLTDRTGNGRHLSQSTDAQRPTLAAASINGLDTLQFNGTGPKRLLASSVSVFNLLHNKNGAGVSAYIIWAMKMEHTSGSSYLFSSQAGGSGRGVFAAAQFNGGNKFHTLDLRIGGRDDFASPLTVAQGNYGSALSSVGDVGLMGISFDADGSPAAQRQTLRWYDGTPLTANVSTQTANANGNSDYPFTIGADIFGSIPTIGKFMEAIVFQGEPSTDIRNRCFGYIAHRWGITAGLDSGHPYKNNPPTV